jgi:hypothetical protein
VPLTRGLAIAAAVGLLLGVATQIGQSLLPAGVGLLANSISPWVSVAFAVGALHARARNAAGAGFLTLAMALVGYYAMVFVRFGYATVGSTLLLWTGGALAGGVVFGLAGYHWRHGTFTTRTVAVALLGAVWVAEAGYLAFVLQMRDVAVAYAVIGLLIPLALGQTGRGRLMAYAALLPAVLLGALGFLALLTLYG